MRDWFSDRCLIEATFPQVANAYRLSFGEFNARTAQAAKLRGAELEDDEFHYTGLLI